MKQQEFEHFLMPQCEEIYMELSEVDVSKKELQKPLHRNTDPDSSRLAEEELRASGDHATQLKHVLRIVNEFPNSTSRELAHFTRCDRYMIARRLPELEEAGLVRKTKDDRGAIVLKKCVVSGRKCVIWEPC